MLVNLVELGGYYCCHLAESIDLEENKEMQAGRWIYIDDGARHERQHTSGIFHFLDRMAFKVYHLIPASLYTFFTQYKSITEHCESVWRANIDP